MTRTDIHQDRCISKLFLVVFVQGSIAIVRTFILSFLFIGLILILTTGLSQAREEAKVQSPNPPALPSASLKTIIVGDYYPYTFVNDKGIPDGFSLDIAKAVAGVMDLKLEIRKDTWENAINALANGAIDFLPMMAASPGRDKYFDFSVPHTIAYDGVFVRTETPRISSLNDLVNKTVIVMNKDAAHDYLLSSGMAARMKLVLVDNLPDALRTLAAGKGDAALMPKLVGLIVMKKLQLTNLDPSPVVIDGYNRPFSLAVKDGNQYLLERLSQGLSIIKTTGKYQEIYKKWFGTLEPQGLPWQTVIKYIAGIGAFFLLIALGLILWSVSLRKQVALRTEKFEAEIQERRKTEKTLGESEERYRTAIEQSNDGVVLVKGDRHVFVNQKMVEIFGYDRPEEIVGKPVDMIVHPDDQERVKDINRRRQEGEAVPQKYEFKGQRKKGEPIYIEVSASKTTYQGEAISLVYLRDITDRKRTESVAQARLRMLTSANKITMTVEEFLQVALDEIEALMGSAIGFYHFLEADQETLSLQNWSTNTLRNMCTTEGKGSHYLISKAGVWVDCVYERRPIIHNDYSSLPHRKGLPPGHAPVIRELAVPIMRDSRIVAIIGIGNKPSDYNQMDVDIALLLGDFSWEIVERKRAEEALKALSIKDDLTGLYNHRGFFALAEQGLKTAQRMGTEMLLIFGDLDNLKKINDTLGHKEGDQALADISQILKETFRESDIIARIGGDEFVILAMNSLETTAEKLINRFEQVLNDHPLQRERPYTLSLSLGIAFFDPQNPCSIEVLLAQADKLMYENKQKKG